jgi:hypothetical protein
VSYDILTISPNAAVQTVSGSRISKMGGILCCWFGNEVLFSGARLSSVLFCHFHILSEPKAKTHSVDAEYSSKPGSPQGSTGVIRVS